MKATFISLLPVFSSFALEKPAPATLSTWNQYVFSGALARAKRSTIGKKIWLSMHPRNFSSEKIVRTSVRTSTPSCTPG